MLPRNRAPTHPGVLLRDLYLEPRKVSVTALAEATGLSRKLLSRIINGRVGFTAETAVRVAEVLGTSDEMWVNGQASYDLWHARRRLSEGVPIRAGAFAVHHTPASASA